MTWVVIASSAPAAYSNPPAKEKKTGTVHDSILQSYSLTRSDKHSLMDDYSFQLDIGHCDQINAVQKCVLTISNNRFDHLRPISN